MPGSSAHLLKRQLGATYIAFRDGLRFSRRRPSRNNFNPHSRTFYIGPASAADTSGFLHTSLSKIRGNPSYSSTRLVSPPISDER